MRHCSGVARCGVVVLLQGRQDDQRRVDRPSDGADQPDDRNRQRDDQTQRWNQYIECGGAGRASVRCTNAS